MARPTDVPTTISGRRGYWRYLYGTHGWIPSTEADFSRGMVRDAPRIDIRPGGVYDSTDYLLHQPGVAQKRGGTTYAGPVFSPVTQAQAQGCVFAEFPAGSQLLGFALNNPAEHLFKVTAGTTTDVGAIVFSLPLLDRPKLRVGGGKNLLIVTSGNGTATPATYDGTTISTLGGSPPGGKFSEVYKTRLVLANTSTNPTRLYFSPTPDIEATWDTSNSYIDTDYAVSGLAALHNALLIFSNGHTYRIIGSTPPPNSDMDLGPVGSVGCTDARSIVVQEDNCLFANPRGVYLTNGAGFASLTTEGQIESYWQGLFSGYDPTTWIMAAGVFRSYYIVSIIDNNGASVATLMCNVPRRAWWRLTNIKATMFAQAVGQSEELYYSDYDSARIISLSSMFNPSASNKNDANGTAVTPMIELRAVGEGTGLKSFGFGRLNYDMRDAATDNPTMAITVKTGVEASTSTTPSESPLSETTNSDNTRKRFTIAKESQAVTIRLAQSNASSKTEIYAVEIESRSAPLGSDGQ